MKRVLNFGREVVPFLQATVKSATGSRVVNFLVDTGATRTLIPARMAVGLTDLDPGRFVAVPDLRDAHGDPFRGIHLPVDIEIAGLKGYRDADVWVVENTEWALLGHKAFFYNFGLVCLNWPGHRKGRRFVLFNRKG